MAKFSIAFSQIENISIEELKELILKSEKKRLAELKLIDLVFEKQSMTGIYVLFDEADIPVYVGKTGSRAILERIAGHFDLRPGAYMNTFLCALAGKRKQRKGPHATEEDLKSVYESALTHKIVFVQVPNTQEHKHKITILESTIAREFGTKYNVIRGTGKYELATRINHI